ncbi:MAG: Mu-like prophage major head subunit gpT [Bacteroidota bacterium]|jgi:phage major head subunit gpT-like protein
MEFRSIREAASRPDFIKLLDSGLKLKMMNAYNNVVSEYEQVVSFEDSTKAKESYPALSGLGYPEKVLEGESFKEDSNFANQSIDITNFKYGKIMAITREMVDDDQTKMIARKPDEMGISHKNYENKVVFSTINRGETAATCYDGLALFTTNHYNRKDGAVHASNDNLYTSASLSAGSINTALNMVALWKGLNDEEINVNPVKLLVPFYLGFTANWLMSGTGMPAYASGAFGAASTQATVIGTSPIKAALQVVVSKWLSKLGGASNDWYLLTDVPGAVFQWRDKLELYKEGDLAVSWFERDVMRWKSRVRFGFDIIDWRFALKVT